MNQQIEIHESVLCDQCSNCQRGVILPGRKVCFDCVDDPELTKQIVLLVHPELTKLDRAIARG